MKGFWSNDTVDKEDRVMNWAMKIITAYAVVLIILSVAIIVLAVHSI